MKINRQNPILALVVLAISALGIPLSASAQNSVITYQGLVTDNGTNFNGVGQFQFSLVTGSNANQQATATANTTSDGSGHYFIASYNLVFGGKGYITAPAVTISGSGGSNATAVAVISGGAVTTVNPQNVGSGYSTAPTVTIAPPPANINYTTYWNNDGTSSGEPSGSVPVSVNNGIFTVALGDTNVANMTAISSLLFATVSNMQLRIWFSDGVNGFAPLNPAQNLTSTPYAANAVTASSAFNLVNGLTVQGNPVYPNIIAGSFFNSINGTDSTIAGGGSVGVPNIINGTSSFIGGGASNAINNIYGVIGGGTDNAVNGYSSTIGGGLVNNVSGNSSTIAGGQFNIASGGEAVVAGGNVNHATGDTAAITGGGYNTASGNRSFVGAGVGNIATNTYSVVVGGDANISGGNGSYIGGGGYDGTSDFGNLATGNASVINGGLGNAVQGDYSTVGGGILNVVSNGSDYSTIAGGYNNLIKPSLIDATIGGGQYNIISGIGTTIAGGEGNTASGITNGSYYGVATVGGGYYNAASGAASVVAGGQNNQAGGTFASVGGGDGNVANAFGSTISGGQDSGITGQFSTIGGGYVNGISGQYSTVAGGFDNSINGQYATIGGGYDNVANGSYATIPGGFGNIASGSNTFAAGQQAQALHAGAFVWADAQTAAFASTSTNQFLIRAYGGVGIDTASPVQGSLSINTNSYHFDHPIFFRGKTGLDTNHGLAYNGGTVTNFGTGQYQIDGPALWGFAGGVLGTRVNGDKAEIVWTSTNVTVTGTFNNNSDRNAKQDFTQVTPSQILDKVAQLPLSEWSYKADSATRHIGPMAQDFYSAFNIGTDERHIAPIDEGGVALAAIQGLNQKLNDKNAEIQHLQQQNDSLEKRLDTLEKLLNKN